jgi:hypothetical protein
MNGGDGEATGRVFPRFSLSLSFPECQTQGNSTGFENNIRNCITGRRIPVHGRIGKKEDGGSVFL